MSPRRHTRGACGVTRSIAASIQTAAPAWLGALPGRLTRVQHLLGVGQRHDQRRVAPDPLVGDVHPLLLAAGGGREGAVDVEVRDRPEHVPAAPAPQLRADRVDRFHQRDHVIRGEPAAEVPGRGRVRDQVCAESVQVCGVMPESFDVLQPGAAAGDVVRQVQHVVGLVVGQMHLQQFQVCVDRGGQAEPGHHPVHRGDPPETGRVHFPADLVMHRTRGQHRSRPRTPLPSQSVPGGDPAAASGRVPPALVLRYPLHHKGLPCRAALRSQTHAR